MRLKRSDIDATFRDNIKREARNIWNSNRLSITLDNETSEVCRRTDTIIALSKLVSQYHHTTKCDNKGEHQEVLEQSDHKKGFKNNLKSIGNFSGYVSLLGLIIFNLLPHCPSNPKDTHYNTCTDQTEETVGVDIEDFLRDDVTIETHTSESDPIDDFGWLIRTDLETPEGEEDNNRVDKECEIREGDTSYHRIWMSDNTGTRNRRIDITTTWDRDTLHWMKDLIGFCTEVGSIAKSDKWEDENDGVFFLHK